MIASNKKHLSGSRAGMLAAALLLTGFATSAQAAFVTVGTYDEQVVQANSVDANATISATPFSGSALTVGDFTTMVATAFANNTGGVFNFDIDDSNTTNIGLATANNAYELTFGTSQSQTLSVTVNGTNNSESGSVEISGNRHLGTGIVSDIWIFDTPLQAFGITILNRNRTALMTFTLEDDSVISPFTNQTVNNDRFFGYQVSNINNGIVKVTITNSNHQHYDDLGFIVATEIPEPASVALLSLGGLLLLCRRNRC